MQPGCQGNCSLRCGRQNGHAPSTSNRPPTTMNTRVTAEPATKCARVKDWPSKNNPYTILTANSATAANTGNSADEMRSRTEPFIRRDPHAARAPTNGSTKYGRTMNWNLVLSKGNQMSTQ